MTKSRPEMFLSNKLIEVLILCSVECHLQQILTFLSESFQYEIEIYFFVICVVAIKNRRCVSVEAYLSTFFLFAKAGAAILFYKMNIQLSIWYIVLCIGKCCLALSFYWIFF